METSHKPPSTTLLSSRQPIRHPDELGVIVGYSVPSQVSVVSRELQVFLDDLHIVGAVGLDLLGTLRVSLLSVQPIQAHCDFTIGQVASKAGDDAIECISRLKGILNFDSTQ